MPNAALPWPHKNQRGIIRAMLEIRNNNVPTISSCPVHERLKQARIKCNISQRGLGIAAGIDTASASARMNQYERGKHVPDYDTLCKLAHVLGVPVPYFYANDDEAGFMLDMARLSDDQQRLVKALVQRINF